MLLHLPCCAVIFFGNDLSATTLAGTSVTLLGTLLYAEAMRASKAAAAKSVGEHSKPARANV